jgi:hypothetical protein
MSLDDTASAPAAAQPADAAHRESAAAAAQVSRAALALLGLGFAALAWAGLLLWSVPGPAVFNGVVLAALAWHF